MKVKQINLRCFEITLQPGEAAEFEAYVNAHEAILRRYLLLLLGAHDPEIEDFLRREGYTFAWGEGAALVNKPASKPAAETVGETPAVRGVQTRVFKRPVRSGELIEHGGDAIFFGRINSGAQVNVSGNCLLFAPLFGLCICDGDAAVVGEVGKGGLFIFHGTVYEGAALKGGKRLFWERGEVKIEDNL